jgi:two-component system, NtrC family, response regulator GlrR
MLPAVLIVEERSVPLAHNVTSALAAQVHCEIRAWDTVAQNAPDCSAAQLLLVHPGPETEQSTVFLQWLREISTPIPVLAILPESSSSEYLRLVADVVDDFIVCPLNDEELRLRVSKLLSPSVGVKCIGRSLSAGLALVQLIGRHPAFLRAKEEVQLFAASEAPVIIYGETGTGKELFAHAIHSLGNRRDGPFIPVDCASLPEHLAENELFGHHRGAFTDARKNQKGLAGMAKGGTLFLDEVDSLSLVVQSKLLRFLQEGSYRPLGADSFTHADVRIIAATNRNLEECVRRNLFRRDLYFRLNVLLLQLPALRNRPGDVSLLAAHFAESEQAGRQCAKKAFSPAALRKLESHHWPGNVRELFNVVQRAILYSSGTSIMPASISLNDPAPVAAQSVPAPMSLSAAKQHMIANFERSSLEELMSRHQGNVTQAAREAGKERRAFGRLLKKYGIQVKDMRAT